MPKKPAKQFPVGKHPGGRPPKFSNPKDMEAKIATYFENCPDKRVVYYEGTKIEIPCPTISGLALFLGFVDRYSMYDYEKKPEFTNTIKRARAFITKIYEQLTHTGTCTGAIFMLKNYGYTDKTEIEHTGDLILNYGHRQQKHS